MVYNYSKIEFYTDYDNMDVVISNALIILNSIEYNDILIERKLENKSNAGDITYQLEGPQGNDFSRYLEEYIPKEENEISLPTEE